MTRAPLALTLATMLLAAPAVAATGDPDGYRLDGKYTADFSRKSYGKSDWRFVPRCAKYACNAKLVSSGGLDGVFVYDDATQSYEIKARYGLSGFCSGKDPETGEQTRIENAYVQNQTVRLTRFSGSKPGETAKFARGSVEDLYRPTKRAQALGCDEPIIKRSQVRLRPR